MAQIGRALEALASIGVSIAAVNGYAMGGGLECAWPVTYASPSAMRRWPCRGHGRPAALRRRHPKPLLGGGGGLQGMILCGERVDAETAVRIGLVEAVVEKGKPWPRPAAGNAGNKAPWPFQVQGPDHARAQGAPGGKLRPEREAVDLAPLRISAGRQRFPREAFAPVA